MGEKGDTFYSDVCFQWKAGSPTTLDQEIAERKKADEAQPKDFLANCMNWKLLWRSSEIAFKEPKLNDNYPLLSFPCRLEIFRR